MAQNLFFYTPATFLSPCDAQKTRRAAGGRQKWGIWENSAEKQVNLMSKLDADLFSLPTRLFQEKIPAHTNVSGASQVHFPTFYFIRLQRKQTSFSFLVMGGIFWLFLRVLVTPEVEKTTPGGPGPALDHPPLAGLTLLASGGQGPPGVVFLNSGPLEPPNPLEKWIQVPERKKYVDFMKTE